MCFTRQTDTWLAAGTSPGPSLSHPMSRAASDKTGRQHSGFAAKRFLCTQHLLFPAGGKPFLHLLGAWVWLPGQGGTRSGSRGLWGLIQSISAESPSILKLCFACRGLQRCSAAIRWLCAGEMWSGTELMAQDRVPTFPGFGGFFCCHAGFIPPLPQRYLWVRVKPMEY